VKEDRERSEGVERGSEAMRDVHEVVSESGDVDEVGLDGEAVV
jgi:hypothetical protein